MRFFLLLLMTFSATTASAGSTGKNTHTSKELRCLALNIYFEAQGEPPAGQLAVALVTHNRKMSKRFPNSFCGVVWQKRQFSWTHDGKSDRPIKNHAWRLAQDIARFVYFKFSQLPQQARQALDITHGALHYYAPELANPYWAKVKVITREIGGHVFLRERS
jgi:spore germination cell wall hydrolase CwlJ-like protein